MNKRKPGRIFVNLGLKIAALAIASVLWLAITNYKDPLIANNNEVLAYFFSMLNFHGIICNKYQSVIANNHLVLSSSGRRYLTQPDISSALRNITSTDNPIMRKIDKWVVLIKSTTFNPL